MFEGLKIARKRFYICIKYIYMEEYDIWKNMIYIIYMIYMEEYDIYEYEYDIWI